MTRNVEVRILSESVVAKASHVKLREAVHAGKPALYIEGIFAQAEQFNRNDRLYPKEVLFPEVERYIREHVERRTALGELDHPEPLEVSSKNASHIVTKLEIRGNDVWGRARVLNTTNGREVQALHSDGVQLAISSRGGGVVSDLPDGRTIVDAYRLMAFDLVTHPSGYGCYVNGINENASAVLESQQMTYRRLRESGEAEIRETNENAERAFSGIVGSALKTFRR